MKKILFFLTLAATLELVTLLSPVFAQTPAPMGELTPECFIDSNKRPAARIYFKKVNGAQDYQWLFKSLTLNLNREYLEYSFNTSSSYYHEDEAKPSFVFQFSPIERYSHQWEATITPVSTLGEKGQGNSITFTCGHLDISEITSICTNKTIKDRTTCARPGYKVVVYSPEVCGAGEEPDPTCSNTEGETQQPPPSNACTKPTGLRNDAPALHPAGDEWVNVILHWDEQAGKKYTIQVKDDDNGSLAVAGPMGVVSCPNGGGDFCISNWESNQITITAKKGKLYLWTINPEGCGTNAASSQFTVGGDESTTPSDNGTGDTPPSGSLRYTCTYSQGDKCYAGRGIGTENARLHNQQGCVYVGGPVLCPGNTSSPGTGSQPGGAQGRPQVVPTPYGGPGNYLCQDNQVSLTTRQDGIKVYLYVTASSQPREGTTNMRVEIDRGINKDNCRWRGEDPGGSGRFVWECTGVDPAMAGQVINWRHFWQKGCVPTASGLSCSGPVCSSKPQSYQLEDTACKTRLVHLQPSVDKSTNQITYKIIADDRSEGTNTIDDTFSPQPFIDDTASCRELTSATYLPVPKPGKVCNIKTNLTPDTEYVWQHKWRHCKGSDGSNCSPVGLCSAEIVYKIAADKTLTIIRQGVGAAAGFQAQAVAPQPTVTPRLSPCPTKKPGPTKAPLLQINELPIATTPCE